MAETAQAVSRKAAGHSYPWYVADWRESETRIRLNLAERGLYRELLDWSYRDGSLPKDEAMLARIAGTDLKSFRRAWVQVQKCFVLGEDGRFHHPKVDDLRPRLERWREQRQEAGRKSASARGSDEEVTRSERGTCGDGNQQQEVAQDSSATESTKGPEIRSTTVERDGQPSSSTSSKLHNPPTPPQGGLFAESASGGQGVVRPDVPAKARKTRPPKRTIEQIEKALGTKRLGWWSEFWRIYPCHEGKRDAMDAFERKVKTEQDWAAVLHGVNCYAQVMQRNPERTPKWAQGWLNSERYYDYADAQPEPIYRPLMQ